jgi:outer membrane murein-binding lipoprotein Lpp
MNRFLLATSIIALGVLAGCQSEKKTPASQVTSGKSASLRTMEQVAIAAHKCWFASKDPAFRAYRMANELNSFSGTPRFLLVPAKDYGARPLLVVQAQGNSSRVDVFGPLMNESLGSRIGSDIGRWRAGDNSCSSAA